MDFERAVDSKDRDPFGRDRNVPPLTDRTADKNVCPTGGAAPLILFAGTIGVGAFLLFQVQPLIAKFILPWFGGSPGVWTTCMLFFQLVLLAGYAYAHVMLRYLGRRGQAVVHVGLLVLALATLPIVPSERWKPTAAGGDPTLRILALLGLSVGLPYLLVASTGPLLQGWLSRGKVAGASVYRLYALSNLASLAALLSYPFLIEPVMTRRGQAVAWSVGFGVFALLSAACAVVAGKSRDETADSQDARSQERTPVLTKALWVLLPACGTLLLLATTNRICQEVAVIPFLWVLPLSIYLLTFVIAFDGPRWYRRGVFMALLPVALAGVSAMLFFGGGLPIAVQLGTYGAALFVACVICHGELARLKPPAGAGLSGYYLTLSAGGAVGGLSVAVAAPLMFATFLEFPLSYVAASVLAGAVVFGDRSSKLYNGRPNWAWICLIVLYMLLGYALVAGHAGAPGRVVAASRSFYGAISVVEHGGDGRDGPDYVMMRHGGITHGIQFADAARRDEPTTYYGRHSGVGLALQRFRAAAPRRIGVVGLGAGTLAVYGRAGDVMRFYEINPDVVAYAQSHFTFLKDSAARVEHVLGDARLSLEREADQQFDVLVLDAFNGDAIPVHLLTRQAFDVYRRHLKPGGLIAVHITNQHLDLRPIVEAAAAYLRLGCLYVPNEHATTLANPFYTSQWVLIGGDAGFLKSLPILPAPEPSSHIKPRLWTDDDTSLFPILR